MNNLLRTLVFCMTSRKKVIVNYKWLGEAKNQSSDIQDEIDEMSDQFRVVN